MRKPLTRATTIVALFAIGVSAAFAQQVSVSANFGSFYGAAPGTHIVYPIVGTAGVYSGSGQQTCKTPVGTVDMPLGWSNPTGHATNEVPVQFIPGSTDGSFSGTCTAKYSNSSSNGPATLTLSVSYSGDNIVPLATAGLKYQILSILYDPPGNASSTGFTNSQSAGSTTSFAQNFSSSDSVTFGGGFLGASNSVTFSTGNSSGSTSSFTTTYTASSGSQLSAPGQHVNHNEDQVYLLIDPELYVTQDGAAAGYFSFGPSVDATGNFGSGGVPADIINVNIAGLKNPSLIPLELLQPQVQVPGTTLPGLSFICANPVPQCTQAPCGCTAADFAAIVAQDELANDTVESTAPSSIDSTRYVYIQAVSLQGPDEAGGGAVKNTYSLSDSNMSSESTSSGTSYGVAFSHKFSLSTDFSLSISYSNNSSFTVSQTQTVGKSNGTAHTGTVTLGTSDVGCYEYVDVYEDSIYHTFAYSLPQPAPADCQ